MMINFNGSYFPFFMALNLEFKKNGFIENIVTTYEDKYVASSSNLNFSTSEDLLCTENMKCQTNRKLLQVG